MEQTTIFCENNCCELQIVKHRQKKKYKNTYSSSKAGIFIYDPYTNKILLVQSNGNLWGIPKGTLENKETYTMCAIRETLEETGISVSKNDFIKYITIYNKCRYFYIEKRECKINVQTNNKNNNDANGITWINLNCLTKCIENGDMVLNSHTNIVINYFLNIKLPRIFNKYYTSK